MTYKQYNLVLAIMLLPVVAVLVLTSAMLQPYSGDLTRLGGYSEKLYGWILPQKEFAQPLYQLSATPVSNYTAPADILVLGDSFTLDQKVSWPNYLVRLTGLRLQAFRADVTPVEKIITSKTFLEHPPRVFIYEIVERNLHSLAIRPNHGCMATRPGNTASPLSVLPVDVAPEPFLRDTHTALFDISLSIDYLTKVVPREYFAVDRTLVRRLSLNRAAPFSSAEKHQLLVYRDDFNKSHWSPELWERVRCGLAEMQNRIQANGRTFFVAMVPPDKLTAYADLLTDRQYVNLSRLDLLASDAALHVPRLDLRLRAAIQDGTVDVYLNNNTHWGSAGHELVADELVEYLQRKHVFAVARRDQP